MAALPLLGQFCNECLHWLNPLACSGRTAFYHDKFSMHHGGNHNMTDSLDDYY